MERVNGKLKVEISNCNFKDTYELKDYLRISMQVMTIDNMFAYKLCALSGWKIIAYRDIFDVWYFLQSKSAINREIVEVRMKMSIYDYTDNVLKKLQSLHNKSLLQGMGKLYDEEMKNFVRNKLLEELISDLKIFKEFGI